MIIPSIRADTLEFAVNSVCNQTWQDWELIIVGQGSDQKLITLGQQLAQRDGRIRYLHLEQMGVSKARNAGMAQASGEIFAFTDDDCEARPDWLATIAACFEAEPEIGLVGGAVTLPVPKTKRFANCPSLVPAEVVYDPVATGRKAPLNWDWISANFAIRRAIYEQAGVFDECLGGGAEFYGAEDTDYKLRLEALGIKMRSTPRSVVNHTYGFRYGLKALLKHQRNYAWGMGALGAKLTLMGDERGVEWRREKLYSSLIEPLKRLRPHKIPKNLLRFYHFNRAYNYCRSNYRVSQWLLHKKSEAPELAGVVPEKSGYLKPEARK